MCVCVFMYVLAGTHICVYIWSIISCVCMRDMQKYGSLLLVKERNKESISMQQKSISRYCSL
jgi:hypothetical protein